MESSKGNRSNGGSLRKRENSEQPSNSKKENLLSSNHCNESKKNSLDCLESSALGQRANNKELSQIDQRDLLNPSFTVSPDTTTGSSHSESCAFEDSLDCVFLNETYSILYSESKLNNERLTHSNSEVESEMKEREEFFFNILGQHGIKTLDLEKIYNISNDLKKNEDVQNCDLDEDSQQEYHSAEEQECRGNCLSFCQAKSSNVATVHAAELRSLGSAENPEDNPANLESSSSISLDSIEAYGQEDSSHAPTTHDKGKGEETSLMYHTIFDEFLLKCSPLEKQESPSKCGFLQPEKTLKTKMYTSTMKSHIPENKTFCGNAVVDNRIVQPHGSPSTVAQGTALEILLQRYEDGQASWDPDFDDPLIAAYGCSHCGSVHSNPCQAIDFSAILPKVSVVNNEAVEENSLRIADGNTTETACFHGVEGKWPASVTDVKRGMLTANQMVDVSADFRACFTTSRATSTRPSVVSTSSNTEITMMNKKRPGEWQRETQRSVACNTDWPCCSHDNKDSQMTRTKGSLGKSLSVDSLKPNGNSLKTSLELRKACDRTDLKKHSEGEFEPAHEMEKDLPSNCCQKTMQRAVTAELHLLHVHYQMCRRHCSDIYQLVTQNRHLLSNSTKKELGEALLSVLGDLKVRYTSLKEKIQGGLPLEELPPLVVETKLLATFSHLASRLMKEDSPVFLGAESELDHQSRSNVGISSDLKKTHSQVLVASDGSSAVQNGSPSDDCNSGEVDVDLSQLKLDDKGGKNYRRLSEDWFDARENLTGVDLAETREDIGEPNVAQDSIQNREQEVLQDSPDVEPMTCLCRNLIPEGVRKNSTADPVSLPEEMKSVEPSRRSKGYLVHVGGLCPSVSEADLRAHFKKYHVCEISIYGSSTQYRYASLTLQKSRDAKTAVKEMNGTEINGKSVNVRLVKTPGECTSPLSTQNGNRVSVNNLEKNSGREINPASSVSRLARTRPRKLGSEQDSELFPFEQGLKKNCKQLESARILPEVPVQFIPPKTLNLRSFTKIVNRLAELHPEISRDRIIDALQEVRTSHKGYLNGLSINTIVEMTSSVLKKSPSSQE